MHARAVRAGRSAASGGRQHATLREGAGFTPLKNYLKDKVKRAVSALSHVSGLTRHGQRSCAGLICAWAAI